MIKLFSYRERSKQEDLLPSICIKMKMHVYQVSRCYNYNKGTSKSIVSFLHIAELIAVARIIKVSLTFFIPLIHLICLLTRDLFRFMYIKVYYGVDIL